MSGLKRLGELTPVIVAFARTPIGSFNGSLRMLAAPILGATAITAALQRCSNPAVDEVFMGHVCSAGVGQSPATQATIKAGLGESVPSSSVNKVCASGMKAVMLAAQSIALGHRDCVVASGMESMSNIPHYLLKSREGLRLGHAQLVDGAIHDGLWDPYNDQHMGLCAEKCAADFALSREAQDAYAAESYRRASAAKSVHAEEISPVEIPGGRGKPSTFVSLDEEPAKFDAAKLASARPAFLATGGTVTAVNASSLNDGAAALVLMSLRRAKSLGLVPLAAIRGFGDAQRAPADFTIAPALAVPAALAMAECALKDVDVHEINEAFSVVALANAKLLELDSARVNVFGGAVSLGHPIGMSGARIIGALCTALKHKDGTLGVASICNGGGGASAIVLDRDV
ncbi:putative acetyl-CoA acetyltransferase [Pelagophyceae sp. CCMP2097]|nr:putative acetyl-CoA acetyltransferase [Pelagophyceae sp. CCMP2097]|mmetsp:Transcript_13888/g.46339  ORF Transcript_13888/g.46339 Transcript_13888/m.46339 type:complete len:400 (+) Transcript_13888:50-1249(+)